MSIPLLSLMTFFSLQPFVYIGVRTHFLFLNSYFFKEVRTRYVPPFSNLTIYALQPFVYVGVRTFLFFLNSYFLIGYVPGTYLFFEFIDFRAAALCLREGTYPVRTHLIISSYMLFFTCFLPFSPFLPYIMESAIALITRAP